MAPMMLLRCCIDLVRAFVLFCPLLVAAALSAVVIRLDLAKALRAPVDGGATFRGRRLFGDHKTWRGFAVAMVGCAVAVAIERALPIPRRLCAVDYASLDPLVFGGALGLGAMLGELPNSFVKRQLGVAPGATAKGARRVVFYLWDQLDLLTGAWPLLAFWVRPTAPLVLGSVALALGLHPIVALLGFVLGARKSAR